MDINSFLDSNIFTWIILPVLLFISRILDVSLMTIRIIYISRGMKLLAAAIGFFEVFLWLLAVSQIMKNLTSPVYYIAYAAGFSMGNYVGMLIEEKLAVGKVSVRIILQEENGLPRLLASKGFGVTRLEGLGSQGPVKMIYTIVNRKDLHRVKELIMDSAPQAFFTIEDIRSFGQGIYPSGLPGRRAGLKSTANA